MKLILGNILIIIGIGIAYYLNIFGWFAAKYTYVFVIALLIIVLVVAMKILGNPFGGEKNNDNK